MEKTSLFGKRLKEERIKLGLNQAEAAEKCGFLVRCGESGSVVKIAHQVKNYSLFLKSASILITSCTADAAKQPPCRLNP
ncbi:helix-turn-helix domain-containing protein [Neisseria gonorrhoeae]|uniref:helix-turn-helix domain-containing protein n=1 Tax=Neisseria gonorrhoeae TaxID=485 RepID=UPI001F0CD3A4|nr:helix-turn-helix transcriptional regulator [Neisseria gonorrhoeae]